MKVNPAKFNRAQRGLSLVELLISVLIAASVLWALSGVSGRALQNFQGTRDKNALNREARFAMEQIVRSIRHSPKLLLPYNDKNWSVGITENIHEVLAVTLDHTTDLDGNGTPDADNDGDGLFDEDTPADSTNDAASGIYLIDDDVDGSIDEVANAESDDESTSINDDPIDGRDDDDDQNLDEDPPADNNADGCPGICGIDDDNDGSVDEGSSDDDDEDGNSDEDWLDAVVFYRSGSQLIQRTPVPWDTNSSSTVDGRDFVESVIADDVSLFRVERLAPANRRRQILSITLDLTNPNSGDTVSLTTHARVGSML